MLNEDHYGLDKVKERILEVSCRSTARGQGQGAHPLPGWPPGVGKTSLGQSIARATNRKFVRMALGGVRDEAEIRGHRRTYIGSMPGKILQSLSKVGAYETHCSARRRSTSWAWTSAVTLHRRCWKCLTPSRTTPSVTITSKSTSTCLM